MVKCCRFVRCENGCITKVKNKIKNSQCNGCIVEPPAIELKTSNYYALQCNHFSAVQKMHIHTFNVYDAMQVFRCEHCMG